MTPVADATLHAFSLLAAGDADLWHMAGVTLGTSFAGLLLAAPPALLLGYGIATHRFRGRRIVIWLAQAALWVPTLFIGLLLALLLAPQGPLGNLHWLASLSGMVLGQCLVALPVLLAFTLAALQALDPRYADTAAALGASPWQVMLRVLHEARFGVMAALLAGCGRVIAEIGCALVVGGNIAGETRSLATALAVDAGRGEVAQAIALGIVLVALGLSISGALVLLQGDARLAREAA